MKGRMKEPKDSARLVLRCCVEKPSYGYAHVRFYPLLNKGGKLEGLGYGALLEDLTISDQIDDKPRTSDERMDYAWSCEFRPHSIGLSDAKRIVKALTMIDKKTEMLRRQFGFNRSYGDFVCRIANAIGANEIVFDSERYEGELHFIEPGHAIDRINREVEKMWRKMRGMPTIEEEREQKEREEAQKCEAAA
jgi:hypothetical protein